MVSVTGAMGMGPRGSIDSFEDKVKRTSQKLAQQGIVLYIVDAKGLEVPLSMTASMSGAMPVRGRGRFEPQQDAETMSTDTKPAMELMSSTTGGRYLYNTNDLMEGFKKAASDLEGSYTLGFYVSDEPDSKWHDLKASVARSGVSLRHRRGYLAEAVASTPTLWTNEMAMAAIANPIGSSAVQLTAYCAPAADGEPGTVQVKLRIEADSLRFQPAGQELQAQVQVIFAGRARGRHRTPHDRCRDGEGGRRAVGSGAAGRTDLRAPLEGGAGRGVAPRRRPGRDHREVRNAGRAAAEARAAAIGAALTSLTR